MNWFLWVLVALGVNWLIGNTAMVLIDDENESIFEWYKSADKELGFFGPFAQFAFIQCWPIAVAMWLKNRTDT